MSTFRFWIAVLLSGSLHVGALTACLLDTWPWSTPDTPAELLEPYGDSDREGFSIEAISLNPGTWRQDDQHTPGGDDASQKQEISLPLEEQPRNVEAKPLQPAPLSLPAVLPDSVKVDIPTKVAEQSADSSSHPKDKPSSSKTGLPGAAGGANMALGTPSKGGTVGKPTGVKFLRAGRKTYPAEAARLGQEGTPLVWLRISEDGDVLEVKLHRSCGHALLDAAALRYALTMKFRPARRGDTPVESTAIQPVEYELP